MAIPKDLGGGTFPDPAYHLGRWYVAWQHGPTLHLVSLWPASLEQVSWNSWTVGEPGVFPRLLAWKGRLFLAHRDGTAGYRIALREIGSSFVEYLDVEATPDPDLGHGSDPVALGEGFIAWQATGAPDFQVWRKPLVGSEAARLVRSGRGTGLSRILPDGTVRTVDEDRDVLTGYTRPCWAGDLTVAEGNNLGAYARLSDGRELTLWPGEEAVTPRCAWDGGDRFGIATWRREGVRFAEVTRSEFALPTTEPDVPVLDTTSVVDVLDYLPLGVTLDGDHLIAYHYTGQQPNVFSIAKHVDGGGEWWAHDDQWVYHHLDQAGSPIEEVNANRFTVRRDAQGNRIDAYYLAPDARSMPRRVKTGDDLIVETRIHRMADGSSEPWRHVNSFEVFSSFPTAMGSGPALRIKYDPRRSIDPDTGRKRGRYEKFVYVVVHGRKYHRWEDWRTKDDNTTDELMQQTQFRQVDTTPVVNWRLSLRPRDASLLPAPGVNKVGVTFERPSFPLDVKVGEQTQFVLKRDVDWPSRVRWWRRDPAGVVESTDWRDPSQDADHTWAWERATTWEVGIEWTGGGTGTRRVVHVAPAGSGPSPGTIGVGLDELRDLHARLESSYQIDQSRHPEITTRVDEEGRPFWMHQYLIKRGAGATHEVAVRSIENAIDRFEERQPRWETPIDPDPGPGPLPPSDLDRIDGQLQLEAGGGFHVAGRPVLPTLCHYGDALSKWMRDRSHVLRNLDLIAGTGYHGTRYWTCLDGTWWNGRHVGEAFQHDYWEQHRAFLLAHKERGLVCQISQGSTTRDALPDPHGFMHRLCDVLLDVGPEVAAVLEGVNEDRDTGNKGPEWLAEFVGIAAARIPQLLRGLSSYTGTEDPVILNRYSRDPAQMFMVHPYRGGRNHDKTRHLMSLQYENGANARAAAGARLASAELRRIADDVDASRRQTALETADWLQRHYPHRVEEIERLLAIGSGQIARLSAAEAEAVVRLMRRNGWNSEGPGVGNRVSAIDNRDEMTGATMCGFAAMSFMMRMAYVYFCGVGVISDDGGSQTFDQMPGFFDVPKVRSLVPADVMRYSGPIFHGGETWRNDRTFAAHGDVRADHVVHHDGRRVIGIYGPGDLNVPQERGFAADVDRRFDNEFRLVVGRAA
jgi:hypothetical protein